MIFVEQLTPVRSHWTHKSKRLKNRFRWKPFFQNNHIILRYYPRIQFYIYFQIISRRQRGSECLFVC